MGSDPTWDGESTSAVGSRVPRDCLARFRPHHNLISRCGAAGVCALPLAAIRRRPGAGRPTAGASEVRLGLHAHRVCPHGRFRYDERRGDGGSGGDGADCGRHNGDLQVSIPPRRPLRGGGGFAILFAVDALIVFLQLCGLFQVEWPEPQTPRKRGS